MDKQPVDALVAAVDVCSDKDSSRGQCEAFNTHRNRGSQSCFASYVSSVFLHDYDCNEAIACLCSKDCIVFGSVFGLRRIAVLVVVVVVKRFSGTSGNAKAATANSASGQIGDVNGYQQQGQLSDNTNNNNDDDD